MTLIGPTLFYLFGTVACLFALACIWYGHRSTRRLLAVGLLVAALGAAVPAVIEAAEIFNPCNEDLLRGIYGDCCWYAIYVIKGCLWAG